MVAEQHLRTIAAQAARIAALEAFVAQMPVYVTRYDGLVANGRWCWWCGQKDGEPPHREDCRWLALDVGREKGVSDATD